MCISLALLPWAHQKNRVTKKGAAMAANFTILGFFLQGADTLSSSDTKWLMIFVGILAFAMLVQAIVFVALAVGAGKMRKKLMGFIDEMQTKVVPLAESVRTLVQDSSPKVKVITENLVETSHIVRSKAQEFDTTLTDVNARAGKQVARVDGMVTNVLDTTSHISTSVQNAVRAPVREINGIINGFKAGLDVLLGRARGFGSKASKERNPMDGGTDLVR
jgi:hypothetical protein